MAVYHAVCPAQGSFIPQARDRYSFMNKGTNNPLNRLSPQQQPRSTIEHTTANNMQEDTNTVGRDRFVIANLCIGQKLGMHAGAEPPNCWLCFLLFVFSCCRRQPPPLLEQCPHLPSRISTFFLRRMRTNRTRLDPRGEVGCAILRLDQSRYVDVVIKLNCSKQRKPTSSQTSKPTSPQTS